MALRSLKLFRAIRSVITIHQSVKSTAVVIPTEHTFTKPKEYKTEHNLIYLEDPDTFGTLAGRSNIQDDTIKDEGDIIEQQHLKNLPLQLQKLTIRQYADIIKQCLKHKRLKEAIDVLELRMLKEDRVKPQNYIYNILIGACAEVGYTQKAFKLFNDMKRRALKPTGDTYTCLFEACTNSPWVTDGLYRAKNLRELMIEKAIEPNLTNYNAMIKAFGRCGDIATAFKIVDEMVSKKIKIRIHTLNHLLHACITDKDNGLRHALIVWRKMLKLREKPNIYSFNLMLKCVKECNLGSKEDIEELIQIIQEQFPTALNKPQVEALLIESTAKNTTETLKNKKQSNSNAFTDVMTSYTEIDKVNNEIYLSKNNEQLDVNSLSINSTNGLAIPLKTDITIVGGNKLVKTEERIVPNLLSKTIKMDKVLFLQEIHSMQDKFAVIGGQEDFIREMETYSVKPDIKIFTQMLPLIEESTEAEMKLLEVIKSQNIKADINFYNMLIKKRCLRHDYAAAFAVKDIIEEESKYRKRKYSMKKKIALKLNIMTYGVLAMACKTKEDAEKLLNEMKEKQLKVNIEILGALLRQGTAHNQFGYVTYIMNIVQEENLQVNEIFVKHLEAFNDKCANILDNKEHNRPKLLEKAYRKFLSTYSHWLKEVNVKHALQSDHPWQQFRENAPETVQHHKVEIVEPKRFYKRNRKYVPYAPRV